MSKIALASSASGAGTITVAAPSSNTDRTLTLPDNTGTLLSTAQLVNDLVTGGINKALTAEQGKVLNAQAFGVGQTWQYVKASRSKNVTYTNTTGKLIVVRIYVGQTTTGDVSIFVGGEAVDSGNTSAVNANNYSLTAFVPPGATYYLGGSPVTNPTYEVWNWFEFR